MTVDMMLTVLAQGDEYGSALKELAMYYGQTNYDLSPITDQMAAEWLNEKYVMQK